MPKFLAAAGVAFLFTVAPAAAVETAAPPSDRGSWTAHIVMDSIAYTQPGGDKSAGRVHARTAWSKSPTQLLVNDAATLPSGEQWIEVLLARKPNGSYGWIKADTTKLHHTPWRVEVDLSSRSVKVYRDGRVVQRSRAVVGARATPTPTGNFAVREIVRQPDAGGFSGPWILHLNANSEKLKTFDGSDAVIGLHGRGGASLNDPLGSAGSHGCIRVPNRIVKFLARHLVAGAPVNVRR